jgi:hypothetical protein
VDSSLVAVSVYLGHAPGVQKAKDTSASEANSLEVPKDEDERLDQQKKEIRSGESRGTVLGGSKIGQDWQAPADEEKRLDRGNPDLTPAERKLLRRAPPAPAQADQDQKQDETKAPQKNKADDQHGSAASGNRDASGSKE